MTCYRDCFSNAVTKLTHGLVLLVLVFTLGMLQTAEGADFDPLDEIALASLAEHHKAMRQLAPQLRIQLRSVRRSMKFDVREIHNIEISIEKSQKDIERLIAMHEANRVNSVRARLLVGDLRRKAASLGQGLTHVTQQIAKKYGLTEVEELQSTTLGEEDAQLLSLLQDYSQLVNQSLQLVSAEAQ